MRCRCLSLLRWRLSDRGSREGEERAKADDNAAIKKGETAGLLEQISPNVFRTSLGNIPASATIKVEVEYIMKPKHDAEVDGPRFTPALHPDTAPYSAISLPTATGSQSPVQTRKEA